MGYIQLKGLKVCFFKSLNEEDRTQTACWLVRHCTTGLRFAWQTTCCILISHLFIRCTYKVYMKLCNYVQNRAESSLVVERLLDGSSSVGGGLT